MSTLLNRTRAEQILAEAGVDVLVATTYQNVYYVSQFQAFGQRFLPTTQVYAVVSADRLDHATGRRLANFLADVADAWQLATDRLQKTHETLRDEVRRLTDELEVKNRELARQNRLADLGQMAAHVAHEVRNSLAPVTLYLSLLRRNELHIVSMCQYCLLSVF